MKLKGKNVSIHDTLKEHNLKGDCIMGDFLNADFNILKIASEEVHKNVPKLYAYDVRVKNNETEAIIAFKIISMLNEYKLASLHFISDNEASLIE